MDPQLIFGVFISGVTVGVLLTMWIFRPDKKKSEAESLRETRYNLIKIKELWLFNVLFNELHRDHPELWTWLKAKIKEYNKL
jgi:hypothetical protein